MTLPLKPYEQAALQAAADGVLLRRPADDTYEIRGTSQSPTGAGRKLRLAGLIELSPLPRRPKCAAREAASLTDAGRIRHKELTETEGATA